ncbi:MAG: hypothetical protein ABMA15_04320 [Vicinamibacterales bacterium]
MMKLLGLALTRKASVCSVVLAAVVLHPVAASAQDPAPVPVAVIVQTSQFDDQAQKDRLDSARDLKVYLNGKKKTLRLVETPAEAVVTIEVLGRGVETQDTQNVNRSAFGGSRVSADKDKVLRVKLSVGDYSTEVEGRSKDGELAFTSWTQAANLASIAIDKWIKTNRAKLP